MKKTFFQKAGIAGACLAPLMLLSSSASQAQQSNIQPVNPTDGLPTITYAFNHTSTATLLGVSYDFDYYDFDVTGFTKVGANNSYYDILSFSNSGLEKKPGVVGVISAYLPIGWTFDDSHDFVISILPNRAIHADDPAFGLIFIEKPGSAPIDPSASPFSFYHAQDGVDPFTINGAPVQVTGTPAVPEASTTVSLGLLLLGGLSGLAFRRKKSV
jgi:hypothetical protein